MRLVLDTNILISAFFWNGNERKVLLKCREKIWESITSPSIIEELNEVLIRKFNVPENKITEYIQDILFFSEIVFTTGEIDVIDRDPDDNIIIETAVKGKSDFIITGDDHLLELGKYNRIKITKASDLLQEH